MAVKFMTKLPDDINARDLEIMRLNTVEKLSVAQTAAKLGISTSTVKRARRKKSYADLAAEALEDEGYSITKFIQNLIESTNATKTVVQNGVTFETPDHVARNQAFKMIGSIYGTEAAKEIENRGGVTTMTDEEIMEALARSIYEYEQAARPKTSPENSRSETSVSSDGKDIAVTAMSN